MKNDLDFSAITAAANNAAIAAKNASDAALSAAQNATIAAKAAADSATAIARVATDTEWMKKSLEGIERKLNEMDKAYVTAAQHADVLRSIENHETRLTSLETEKTRSMVLLTIGSALLIFLGGLLIKHLTGN